VKLKSKRSFDDRVKSGELLHKAGGNFFGRRLRNGFKFEGRRKSALINTFSVVAIDSAKNVLRVPLVAAEKLCQAPNRKP
jgi:hypothetical protein